MDSFNKVISFVLGLVVVLVFFAVVTGKLKLPGRISTPFSKVVSPTPTPVSTIKIEEKTDTSALINNYKSQTTSANTSSRPRSIPATGLPTLFFPSLLAGLAGGLFLRGAGKK